ASTSTSNAVTTINVLSSHASTWDVEAAQVGRIGGADRIATAVAVSKDSFPAGNAGAVVLARADDYPDALVGAPLAAAKNAPLLLTQGAQLPKATSDEITRVLPAGGTVYVLGGTAAVPDSVVKQLKSSGLTVVREAGADRYATAVAVATELGDPTTVLLATGTNFPDALAAGPAAAHLHGVVLLTAGSVLPTATSTYLSAHAGSTYAVGGPAVKADPAATPLSGADRFATAATVASTLFASPAMVGIATGQAFPDALSGGAQLARADAPLLLATKTTVPAPTSGYLTDAGANLHTIHLFGGPAVLADTLLTPLQALTN
ncbi:MAG TPA: cell wall-binding repeat-containing protein, partial [Acidothermaceae bacterium]|nr:cell wall-binding repeat-containing protein [Acidothermaceae bacterium]